MINRFHHTYISIFSQGKLAVCILIWKYSPLYKTTIIFDIHKAFFIIYTQQLKERNSLKKSSFLNFFDWRLLKYFRYILLNFVKRSCKKYCWRLKIISLVQDLDIRPFFFLLYSIVVLYICHTFQLYQYAPIFDNPSRLF